METTNKSTDMFLMTSLEEAPINIQKLITGSDNASVANHAKSRFKPNNRCYARDNMLTVIDAHLMTMLRLACNIAVIQCPDKEGLIAVDDSDELTIARLKAELEKNKITAATAVQISRLEQRLKTERFELERFGNYASMFAFYTGFSSQKSLIGFFKWVEPTVQNKQSPYYTPSDTLSLAGQPSKSGDSMIADKGFTIKNLLEAKVGFNIPYYP
ncbi:hypothetical protein LSH36_241g06017 [Paralvinella palmiformis]|uniref:DDE Tnp4 domain-containing protein n=1 Tax=Paralvinella palmiformis TaxID=53620 RepID=A0AAD9JLW4_9ANNE|nr:hypothetical protein LSH36_241g06017 [Paralvinella palmiformis]